MAANVRLDSSGKRDDGGGGLSSEQTKKGREDLRSGLVQQVSSEHSKTKRSEILQRLGKITEEFFSGRPLPLPKAFREDSFGFFQPEKQNLVLYDDQIPHQPLCPR